jgi:phage head maturation protease
MNDALVELREGSPGKLVLRGHASVAGRWYPVGRMFEEKFKRGAWRRGLAEDPHTVLLEDHTGLGFASTKVPGADPTLLLSENSRGDLIAEAFLDATAPRVQDLRSTAENCGLQMSVAFLCSQDNWNEDRSRREVKQASVHKGDVTVCNFGANEASTATISERGEAGALERRAYADSLKGSRERRMCPDLEELESGLTVVRGRSQISVPASVTRRSQIELAKSYAAKGSGGKARPRPVTTPRAKAIRARLRRGL